jgi:hypothetical protein
MNRKILAGGWLAGRKGAVLAVAGVLGVVAAYMIGEASLVDVIRAVLQVMAAEDPAGPI